jgi:hypothetical protein
MILSTGFPGGEIAMTKKQKGLKKIKPKKPGKNALSSQKGKFLRIKILA